MSDDRERWARIQTLFHDALQQPPAERERFVRERAANAALADDVLELLAEDARAGSILDAGLERVAYEALEGGVNPAHRDLGPYRLGALLGEGGMGVVFLAERADLNSRVAIKILRDAWLSPSRRERFASEQRTLARLNHPCIARLYDADSLPDGAPWFAMEYVDGLPLTRYCAEHALPVRATLELFRSVCEAVRHAHQHAVIHRDLKPSNILVTAEGQPKLLDFGIARSMEGLDSRGERTRTELRLMTPAYAAPEQFRGGSQGAHTDIYALGAILYELLTGRRPLELEGLDPVETAERVVREEPLKPSLALKRMAEAGAGPATPAGERAERARARLDERGVEWPELDVICATALQKEPERRYRSVESMIRDLDHYLHGEPLEARTDTFGYRTGKFVRRHRRSLALTALVLASVVGLVAYYTVRLERARNAALAEVARTRRVQEFMKQLFSGGDTEAGPSDTLRVVTILDRGVVGARVFANDPDIEVELLHTLGTSFHDLGQLARADSAFSASLRIVRAERPHDEAALQRALLDLGSLRSDQSRYDEAAKLIDEALAHARARERSDPAEWARALTVQGEMLVSRGDYGLAVTALEEAARRDSALGLPARELWNTLSDLSNAHYYLGHLGVADSLDQRALALDIATFGPKHPNVAADYMNLGGVQQERARWPEAEKNFRAALAIYQGWFGDDHFETASALTAVGRALDAQGRHAEALAMLQRALASRERSAGPESPGVAVTLTDIANVESDEGRFADAERDLLRAIAIQRKAYDDRHYQIGLTYSNLGGVYAAAHRTADAERSFHEALRRYSETLPAGHLNFGITLYKLGHTLLQASRLEEAEHESRAAYANMTAQTDPPEYWLKSVRTDLAAEYQRLGRPADAAQFRVAPPP